MQPACNRFKKLQDAGAFACFGDFSFGYEFLARDNDVVELALVEPDSRAFSAHIHGHIRIGIIEAEKNAAAFRAGQIRRRGVFREFQEFCGRLGDLLDFSLVEPDAFAGGAFVEGCFFRLDFLHGFSFTSRAFHMIFLVKGTSQRNLPYCKHREAVVKKYARLRRGECKNNGIGLICPQKDFKIWFTGLLTDII
jgi:hypothetical protein